MVGLPCSGKTAWARELERQHAAIRLTPDEWHVPLFGQDAEDPEHDRRHAAVEALLWDLAAKLLARGIDVILDFGFWTREERDGFRARAAQLGADCVIHYAEASLDVLLARLAARNAELPPGTFAIRESDIRAWAARFEAPTPDEQAATG
jgi:predicted kinase